jgi:hypothetical protein
MSSQRQSSQTSAPTTPTKSAAAAKWRQKDILTTPRTAKTLAMQKTLVNGPNYTAPQNFDDETHFNEQSMLMGKTIQVGNSYFTYGKNMAEYKDSTLLYRSGNRTALLDRLDTDGYILIRGAVKYETAAKGREKMIDHLHKKGAFDLKKGTKSQAFIKDMTEDGWTVDAETGGFVNNRESDEAIDGWREIGWCDEVRNVYNGPDLHAVYRFLWGKPRTTAEDGYVALSQNTWLRAKGKGETTSEHADYYYFKENTTTFQENRHPYTENAAEMWNEENPLDGVAEKDVIECDLCCRKLDATKQLPKATGWDKSVKGEWHCHDCASQFTPFYTCWISLGEYLDDNSTLAMMPKTQGLQEFDKPLKTNLLPEDYNDLVKQKWGWLRTNFGLGDIVIFNWKTVHGASKNTMEQFRFSFDTRVSASWFRPKALFGDNYKIKYDYPQVAESNQPKEVSLDKKYSGAVESIEFCPKIENTQCPTQLSLKFIQEQAAAQKSGIERRRRIGTMASKPKVMGMGAKKGMDACDQSEDDDDDEDEEEENQDKNKKPAPKTRKTAQTSSQQQDVLDSDTEQQNASRARAARITARGKKNGNLGADGVGRWGNDDDDDGNASQSSQPSTPSRRQQRILRERTAVELDPEDKFGLESVMEEDSPSTNINNDEDDAHKKARVRKAAQQEVLDSDNEDGMVTAKLVKKVRK